MGQTDDINAMINDALNVANANTVQAKTTADTANAALFKQLSANIDAYLTPVVAPPIVVIPPPVQPNDPSIPNTQEKLFDSMHVAYGSPVDAKGSVTSIPDRIGKYSLSWNGLSDWNGQPGNASKGLTITGIKPQILDAQWLMFDNRPNTAYNSTMLDNKVPPPFEVWFVTRNLPGQEFETKSKNGPNGTYSGDLGKTIRVYGSYGGISAAKPVNYITVVERYVMKPTQVEYWVNNVLQGTYLINNPTAIGDIVPNGTKQMHSVGVDTNSMDFDWAATYFKGSLFSASDATAIYNSLVAKWAVGSIPTNQILLSSIRWDNKNGNYTPSSVISNTPLGITVADPSKWKYQWFWKDDSTNYDVQTLFSTKQIVTAADFPAGYASKSNFCIKYRVMPVDVNGNGWRYFSGVFNVYTQGSSMQ